MENDHIGGCRWSAPVELADQGFDAVGGEAAAFITGATVAADSKPLGRL
jgi:hypothetical protein